MKNPPMKTGFLSFFQITLFEKPIDEMIPSKHPMFTHVLLANCVETIGVQM